MDQARTSEKKKKIKMGKLLQFPMHRVKRAVPEVTISDEQKQHFKEEQFIEQLTEQLSLDVLEVLKENVVDIAGVPRLNIGAVRSIGFATTIPLYNQVPLMS